MSITLETDSNVCSSSVQASTVRSTITIALVTHVTMVSARTASTAMTVSASLASLVRPSEDHNSRTFSDKPSHSPRTRLIEHTECSCCLVPQVPSVTWKSMSVHPAPAGMEEHVWMRRMDSTASVPRASSPHTVTPRWMNVAAVLVSMERAEMISTGKSCDILLGHC